ncbi:MAG: nitrous oxide reductase family maturation protein NosD [Ardenticatenales bacterium]
MARATLRAISIVAAGWWMVMVAATPASALPSTQAAATAWVPRTIDVGAGRPFEDISAAVTAARDGDTVVVHGGVYAGPLVVERRITVVGVDQPVIDGGGSGTVVQLRAAGARFGGFAVRNGGDRLDEEDAAVAVYAPAVVENNVITEVLFGIDVQRAPGSVITNNRVTGRDLPIPRRGDAIRVWESAGTRVERNRIDRARDVVIWFSKNVTVADNTVAHSRYGLHFMYAAGSHVTGNHLDRNAVGAFAMYSSDLRYERNLLTGNHGPSGYGLALKESSRIVIVDNIIAGNRTGIYFDNSPLEPDAFNEVARNTIAYNDVGLAFVPSVKRNRFTANRFEENMQQVAVVASGTFEGNDWTVDGVGNYWSDYSGFDADGDHIGDVPHAESSLFHSLLADHPALRLFSLSPAQSTVDLAARAFPIFRPLPTLVDDAPLTHAPRSSIVLARPSAGPLLAESAACVALALAVAAWGRRLGDAGRAPAVPPAGAWTAIDGARWRS